MLDQGLFSWVIILLILMTFLLTVYGYCYEKIGLGHYWDLTKGLIVTVIHARSRPTLIHAINESIT